MVILERHSQLDSSEPSRQSSSPSHCQPTGTHSLWSVHWNLSGGHVGDAGHTNTNDHKLLWNRYFSNHFLHSSLVACMMIGLNKMYIVSTRWRDGVHQVAGQYPPSGGAVSTRWWDVPNLISHISSVKLHRVYTTHKMTSSPVTRRRRCHNLHLWLRDRSNDHHKTRALIKLMALTMSCNVCIQQKGLVTFQPTNQVRFRVLISSDRTSTDHSRNDHAQWPLHLRQSSSSAPSGQSFSPSHFHACAIHHFPGAISTPHLNKSAGHSGV